MSLRVGTGLYIAAFGSDHHARLQLPSVRRSVGTMQEASGDTGGLDYFSLVVKIRVAVGGTVLNPMT